MCCDRGNAKSFVCKTRFRLAFLGPVTDNSRVVPSNSYIRCQGVQIGETVIDTVGETAEGRPVEYTQTKKFIACSWPSSDTMDVGQFGKKEKHVNTAVSMHNVEQDLTQSPVSPQGRKRFLSESKILAFGFWIFYLLCGFYLTLHLHYYAGDALSRVANAYDVLFGRNPHLGAVGFIWNPLPTVFELPIVALHPFFPAVVTKGLAGIVVSGVFGAWGAVHMNRILRNFAVPHTFRLIITCIFALNPLIILYASNGMSDLMLVTCILGTYSGVFDYLSEHSLRRLAAAGIWMAMGLGMRYEAVPFGALAILGMMAGLWGKVDAAHWKGAAVILGSPIVFSGGLWIYFNWLIMKNPLYFLDSNYGNLAQTRTGSFLTPSLSSARHSLIGTGAYIFHFSLLFWPVSLAAAVTALFLVGRWRDSRAPILMGGALGAITLEIAFAYLGNLGPWDRYFLSFIPDGVLFTAFVGARLQANMHGHWRMVWWTALSLLLLSGDIGTVMALKSPMLGRPDGQVIAAALHGKSMKDISDAFTAVDPVVQYLDAHPHLTVLTDSFNAWAITVRSTNFNRFIITADYNFAAILHNPRGRVNAFLVPQPSGVGALNAVNRAWPSLWAGRTRWVTLIKSFPGGANWKLYAVTSEAP